MSVAPAAFSKEKNNVLFLIVSGFIVVSFWSCGSKKNSGDTVLVSQQAAVKDTLPAMALTRYLTALKEGNEAAARAVFYDEATPFTLTAPVPITDYKVISEGSINATEALRFDFQPAPQAGDVQMDVQQYITPHNEKLMFSYWLRKKDDIWKLATWTLWNADLQDSFAGFRDTSRRDSSVVEDLALPVGDINFSPDTAKTSYSPVPYDTINASVAIFTANEKIADLSKTASTGSAITIYEAHFANMVALTADACKNRDNDDVVYWDYYADGGKKLVGRFPIACMTAKEYLKILGVGKEPVERMVRLNEKGKPKKKAVPVLNLNNAGKVVLFKNFVHSIQPLPKKFALPADAAATAKVK